MAENKLIAEFLATGHALALTVVDAIAVGEFDSIPVYEGHTIALRDMAVIFRYPVRRYRATHVTPERLKAGNTIKGDLRALLRDMLATLPEQQFVAAVALIDGGGVGRTYEQAACAARMSPGAFKQHLHRVRTHYPDLYSQVLAYRRLQLLRRHAAAEKRARRHTSEWFWKLRRLEERNDAMAARIEAAYEAGRRQRALSRWARR